MNRPRQSKDIERLFNDPSVIQAALAKGVREALRRHKQAGLPVVQWRNGKVVWVPPEQIKVDGFSQSRHRYQKGRRRL